MSNEELSDITPSPSSGKDNEIDQGIEKYVQTVVEHGLMFTLDRWVVR